LNIYEYVLSTNAQIGHSLGGALATIAAVDSYTFLTNQTKIHSSSQFKVYSFGQPRIGNENFAKQVQILLDKGALNITRITAFDDLIPQIPPRFLGYVHHGAQEVWITATNFEQQRNEIYVCDILPEDPRCSNSLAVYSLPTHLLYWDVLFGPWC
jgi:predicted lipase